MKLLPSPLKKFYKKLQIIYFNKKNNTKIHSISASRKAKYGNEVLIADKTVVNDDVEIGDYSYINSGSYIENCLIGKFCSISSGVYISPAEHNHQMRTTHPITSFGKEKSARIPVQIGNDVLISLNAIILEGVVIGNGAVIGAGAIVTKNVLPYEIVGGIPAKHIKFRFTTDKIEELQSLKWWDWEIDKVKRNIEFLRNRIDIIYK